MAGKADKSTALKKFREAAVKRTNPISEDLIAPCGMNCAICSRYLAYVNHLKRSQCTGCRPGNQGCAHLFKKCTGINHISRGDAPFCFECEQYPCRQIERIDMRYRNNYHMSMKENLTAVQKMGIGRFVNEQYQKYRCARCGGLISVHNGKCFHCDTITKLIDKDNVRKYE